MHYLLITIFLLLHNHGVHSGEEAEHRDFQYNSVVDPQTGRYNFAYDTGHNNEIAHSLHMQYRDANGIVRGRYGYTDPRGKLRMVEYEAGPNGFVARGDVGPDQFPHDQTPQTQQYSGLASYTQSNDLDLVPRPVQMAGWDPGQDPMGQPVAANPGDGDGNSQDLAGVRTESGTIDVTDGGYMMTANNTSSDNSYGTEERSYDDRYPRIPIFANENNGRESEDLSSQNPEEKKSEMVREEYPVAGPLTLNTIDVNPSDIRQTSGNQDPVGRSAEGSRTVRALPYSYRNYRRPATHDHDSETRTQATGYRVVYRSNHDHENEMRAQERDAARRRYYINRYTHDHDAERRYYANRRTHDHAAERRRYYDAVRRRYYYVNRPTHNNDAERRNYYRYPNRRRIFYRDDHSDIPHEHYDDIYRNDLDRYHQHSDRQLYGRSQNLQVPATASPRQLRYIPSDKYHDKYYYWN